MAYRSKRQWRWAFANRKPWARRWARETKSYKRLPTRRRRRKRRKR